MANSFSLKLKKATLIGLLSFAPFVSLAHDIGEDHPHAEDGASTTPLSVLEVVNKDEKKEEIRKQLKDTMDLCSALVHKIRSLAGRISDRESLLIDKGLLGKDAVEKIDIKHKELDKKLDSATTIISGNMVKIAENILNSDKPVKLAKDFKKEVGKVKSELISGQKLVLEIIELIKKETSQPEEVEAGIGESATSSSEEGSN